MRMKILQEEEKKMNFLMFLVSALVPIAGFAYVMLFIQGTLIDTIVFSVTAGAVLVRLFEKQLGRLAKYFYISLFPVFGAVTIIVGNDGKFGALTHCYFITLIMAIAYYDASVAKVNAIVTLGVNALGLLIFNDAYTKMHSTLIWIFIAIVYILGFLAALIITDRTYQLFGRLEEQEQQSVDVLENVKTAFEGLETSADHIYTSLHSFEKISQEIAASTGHISDGVNIQTQEVEGSMGIFNDLSERIVSSENRVEQTVSSMRGLKERNDEGIVSIQKLSEQFDENIRSTQAASEEIATLSQKSALIGGIVDSIHQIAAQTNLLALNAAIEAARAGEAGKGFAVVADEINTLSAQSADATKKIDEILKDIITTVEHANKIMENNKEIVSESNDKLKDTVDIFQDMLKYSEEVIQTANLLKDELESIVSIKDTLLHSMQKVSDMSEESSNATAGISSSTAEQVEGVNHIIEAMGHVQHSIDKLSAILNKENGR